MWESNSETGIDTQQQEIWENNINHVDKHVALYSYWTLALCQILFQLLAEFIAFSSTCVWTEFLVCVCVWDQVERVPNEEAGSPKARSCFCSSSRTSKAQEVKCNHMNINTRCKNLYLSLRLQCSIFAWVTCPGWFVSGRKKKYKSISLLISSLSNLQCKIDSWPSRILRCTDRVEEM